MVRNAYDSIVKRGALQNRKKISQLCEFDLLEIIWTGIDSAAGDDDDGWLTGNQ